MHWHRVLIEWPAKLFTWWWNAYALVLTVVIMVVVTITVLVIALDQMGIRWGW
jgi:hypothetical protein